MSNYKIQIGNMARALCKKEISCSNFLSGAAKNSDDEDVARLIQIVTEAPKTGDFIEESQQGTQTCIAIFHLEDKLLRASPMEISMTVTDILVGFHAEWLRYLRENDEHNLSHITSAIDGLQDIVALHGGHMQLWQLLDDMIYIARENDFLDEKIGGKAADLMPGVTKRIQELTEKQKPRD